MGRPQLAVASPSETTVDTGLHGAEHLVRGKARRRDVDAAADQPDQGHLTLDRRIPDRRPATARVPAHHPRAGLQLDASQARARRDLHACGRGLEDVGAAVAVENRIGSFQEVRKGLAVVAVADDATATLRRDRAEHTAKRAAAAADGEIPHARPKRAAARLLARAASTSRSRGAAVVTSEARSSRATSLVRSTARAKAASFVRDGLLKPESLRTNWSAAARTSSSVTGGSKLKSVLMLRHMPWPPGLRTNGTTRSSSSRDLLQEALSSKLRSISSKPGRTAGRSSS